MVFAKCARRLISSVADIKRTSQIPFPLAVIVVRPIKERNIMNETVTVEEAISRGHWMITYPLYIIMFGTLVIGGPLVFLNILTPSVFLICFALSFGLAVLWWKIMFNKWRIWAFDNVRNVHELKKRAIREKLFSAKSSIFETLLSSKVDKEKWSLLQDKFKQQDLFQDDLTIPSETIIYEGKINYLLPFMFGFFMLGLGLFVFAISVAITTFNLDVFFVIFVGLIFIIIGALGGYSSIKSTKEASNKVPLFILNDKGIITTSTDFYEWSQIQNEEIIGEEQGSGKNAKTYLYLTYDHPKGAERLWIKNNYVKDIEKLNKLLVIYRGRYNNKTTNR